MTEPYYQAIIIILFLTIISELLIMIQNSLIRKIDLRNLLESQNVIRELRAQIKEVLEEKSRFSRFIENEYIKKVGPGFAITPDGIKMLPKEWDKGWKEILETQGKN